MCCVLEEIVYTQLENLNAMHDLLSIMKHQNELITSVNKKLEEEISDYKRKLYPVVEWKVRENEHRQGIFIPLSGRTTGMP